MVSINYVFKEKIKEYYCSVKEVDGEFKWVINCSGWDFPYNYIASGFVGDKESAISILKFIVNEL